MDHDPNNYNELFGEQDSFHFPAPTQQGPTRKSSIEIKQLEHIVSPANIPITYKNFTLHSPSPFKAHINFYESQQSSLHDNSQNFEIQPRRNMIKTPLDFNESPRKRSPHLNTAHSNKIIFKNPQQTVYSSNIKEDKKNSKGLRNLSQSVFKIVIQKGVTTYKQVADLLVSKLNAGQFGPLDEGVQKSKDQQNIKRRVYDALNVLISAGVLKKSGKQVTSLNQDLISEKAKMANRIAKKQDKDNLFQQIIKKEQVIKQKRQRIQEMKNKIQILNAILKRNRKKKTQQKQKVNFPILAFVYRKAIPKLIRNDTNSKISLPSANLLEVIADMDLLVKVGIDVLNQNIDDIIQQVSQQEAEQNLISKKKGKSEQVSTTSRQKLTRVLYSL